MTFPEIDKATRSSAELDNVHTMEDPNCGAADNPARVRKIIDARTKLLQASAVGYSSYPDKQIKKLFFKNFLDLKKKI